jgi:hypothetical protein
MTRALGTSVDPIRAQREHEPQRALRRGPPGRSWWPSLLLVASCSGQGRGDGSAPSSSERDFGCTVDSTGAVRCWSTCLDPATDTLSPVRELRSEGAAFVDASLSVHNVDLVLLSADGRLGVWGLTTRRESERAQLRDQYRVPGRVRDASFGNQVAVYRALDGSVWDFGRDTCNLDDPDTRTPFPGRRILDGPLR